MQSVMRFITFFIGVLGFFSLKVQIKDGDAKEVLANVLLIVGFYGICACMVILPWALPLIAEIIKCRNQ